MAMTRDLLGSRQQTANLSERILNSMCQVTSAIHFRSKTKKK